MAQAFRIDGPTSGEGDAVAAVLADLPEWFGVPESTAAYVAAAATTANYVARGPGGEALAVVLVERHFAASADVHVMAVRRAWHRRGVGRALLAAVEADLSAAGVHILTVKTLGPSDPDEGYRGTRAFYEAMGFVPLEELRGVWGDTPCLLMAKPLV